MDQQTNEKTNDQAIIKINELNIEKINELKIELKIEKTNELTIEKINEQTNEKTNKSRNEKINEKIIELTMEPTNEPTNELTNTQLKLAKIDEVTIAQTKEKTKEKTNVSDGILVLSINWAIVVVICIVMVKPDWSNFTMLYSFMKALSISTFLAIIIYVLLAKKSHFETKTKIVSLVLLFILVNVSAYFIGRYNYWNTVKIALSPIEESYSPKIQAELKKINDRINELSPVLYRDPESKLQVYEYIPMIDEMIELQKQSFDINDNFHNNISEGLTKEPVLKPAELKGILKDRLNINVDALPDFRLKYRLWFNSINACLSAKKSSYQSYRDNEPDYTQDLKLRWADGFCSRYEQPWTDMTQAKLRFMGKKP